MKRIYINILLAFGLLLVSCEVTEFDLQDNPNELTPDQVNPDFLLNEIQIQFKNLMMEMVRNTDDIMRYEAMLNSYTDIAEAGVLDFEWATMYGLRNNAILLKELSESDEDLNFHLGIAKLLEAYGMTTLVDYIGEVPFSQANQPNEFPNPVADSGRDVYNQALAMIDEAIQHFSSATRAPTSDLYYDGDAAKWTTFANSLKLRLLLQTRLVDSGVKSQIDALISNGNLIMSTGNDFQFQFSTEIEPDSRHFYFERGYSTNGPSEYMGNYFMWLLKDSKSVADPRLRYYLYRQTDKDLTVEAPLLRCLGEPIFDYCYVGDLYYGRDHEDISTRPADRFLKTTYGLYPGGGSFDDDNFVTALESTNLGGAGILPMLTSATVKFLMAEGALTIDTSGDALSHLKDAIEESMDKVTNFASVGDATHAATSEQIDAYIDVVEEEYMNAASEDERLNIIIREAYLAGFGFSVDAYNAYRRTGFPSSMQEPINNPTIPFPRSFLYPEDATNANTSLVPKSHTVKVFWDNNPDGFIK